MDMIADILLAAGALGAATYCVILAGRLKRFNNLQNGVGGAVAILSAQVDDMTRTLQTAQNAAVTSSTTLTSLTERAEDVSKRLELVLASMHDLPDSHPNAEQTGPASSQNPPRSPTPKHAAEAVDGPLFLSNRVRIMEAAE